MTEPPAYLFVRGRLPLLVSVPHDGRRIPAEMAANMTDAAMALPDTDWYVARLYAFARLLGASLLIANYSRYVIDLNRPADDEDLYPGQLSTGLCPSRTFSGEPLYKDHRDVSADERARRVERYWRPYHDRLAQELAATRARHGRALLWDAHSIASQVPSLFDGRLPDLNIGTDNGRSCDARMLAAINQVAENSPYSSVVNGRFRGGYITRHFGQPAEDVYAVQLELSQSCYLDEGSLRYDEMKAERLITSLSGMLQAFIDSAKSTGSEINAQDPES